MAKGKTASPRDQRGTRDQRGQPVGRRAYPRRKAPKPRYNYRRLYLEGERHFELGRATHDALKLTQELVEDSTGIDDATWIARKIGKRTQDVAARLTNVAARTAQLGFRRLSNALGEYVGAVVGHVRSGRGSVAFDRGPAYEDEKDLFVGPRYNDSASDEEVLRIYVSHRAWQTGFSRECSWVEIWASAGFGGSPVPDSPRPPSHSHILVLATRSEDPVPTDKQLADAAGRSVDTIRKLRRRHTDLTAKSAVAGGAALMEMFRRMKEDADHAATLPRPTEESPGK